MGDFDENFDDVPLPPVTIAAIAELPEIKLFSRWSCDDVQVADMSLQVIFNQIHIREVFPRPF